MIILLTSYSKPSHSTVPARQQEEPPSKALFFHHDAEDLSIRSEKHTLAATECLKLRSNSILMQGCHANFYHDRISLGIIQDLAPLAHPTYQRSDFLF